MQPPSLRTPLGVLAIGLLVMALLLVRPADYPVAHSQGYAAPATATPPPPTAVVQPTSAAVSSPTRAVPTAVIETTVAPTVFVATQRPIPTRPPVQPTEELITTPSALEEVTNAITCTYGVPIEINGFAPPRAALLLYFGPRAVGGGSAAADGSFTLILNVGNERSGSYPVSVLVRGSWQEVAHTTCVVPYLSPTPRIVN